MASCSLTLARPTDGEDRYSITKSSSFWPGRLDESRFLATVIPLDLVHHTISSGTAAALGRLLSDSGFCRKENHRNELAQRRNLSGSARPQQKGFPEPDRPGNPDAKRFGSTPRLASYITFEGRQPAFRTVASCALPVLFFESGTCCMDAQMLKKILVEMANGERNAPIARRLGCDRRTVRRYRRLARTLDACVHDLAALPLEELRAIFNARMPRHEEPDFAGLAAEFPGSTARFRFERYRERRLAKGRNAMSLSQFNRLRFEHEFRKSGAARFALPMLPRSSMTVGRWTP